MPILDANSLEFISRSADQTRRVGMRLGAMVADREVVCLAGDLGSGKTTFIQGFASGWGSLDPVTSPTFVLINLYRRPDGGKLYHLDAYRLEGPKEVLDLDLDAMLESGPPKEHLWISLRLVGPQQRDLIFTAHGSRYQSLLAKFRQRLYGGL
jgi:tRNA threonylcarbamoyladenosine biosynthesis protein TsaE